MRPYGRHRAGKIRPPAPAQVQVRQLAGMKAMIRIPEPLFTRYSQVLKKEDVAVAFHPEYGKWLRYYLDFCGKYVVTADQSERLRLFLRKLREKKQGEPRCGRAEHAVSLYHAMPHAGESTRAESTPFIAGGEPPTKPATIAEAQTDAYATEQHTVIAPAGYRAAASRKSQYLPAGYQEKSDSREWDAVLEKLAAEIRIRHYSRKTLQAYAKWSRSFQRFLRNKPPEQLATADVKEYLTFLAVKCNVAASTQNQAFNSLLFLYRHALKKDFGDLRDVPRAKKSLYNYRSIDCRLKAYRRKRCVIIQN